MAPTPIDYPTLIAQLPYVSKLATSEQTHAEVRQEIFGPMILQQLREKEKEKVPEVNKKEKSIAVDREGGGGGQSGAGPGGERKHSEREEEEHEVSSSPWTGNIIDRKI